MTYISRSIEPILHKILQAKKSVLLLGPRQTGKTTLLKSIKVDWFINLLHSSVRLRYEREPSLLKKEIEHLAHPLIVIDEIQKIPVLLDTIQDIIDEDLAQFVLTGSSARKLRRHEVNLLPGRVINLELSPLSLIELGDKEPTIEDLLLYGSLPGMIQTPELEIKERLLQTYVNSYLEEEIRAEALVRNVAAFSHFLELAANESGQLINTSKLSQEIGVSHVTIQEYYQILLDTLVAVRVESFSAAKTRRQLIRSPKYIIFDLGVRRLAAREGILLSDTEKGHLFEQFIGLELLKLTQYCTPKPQLYFWRDRNGIEVDYILKMNQKLIPIEVKWTEYPTVSDCRHLNLFLDEYNVSQGYIVSRIPHRISLTDRIDALPFHQLASLLGSDTI